MRLTSCALWLFLLVASCGPAEWVEVRPEDGRTVGDHPRPLERQVAGARADVEDGSLGEGRGHGGAAPSTVAVERQEVVQEVVTSRDSAEHPADRARLPDGVDGVGHGGRGL